MIPGPTAARIAGGSGHAIAVQAGAVDDEVGGEIAGRGLSAGDRPFGVGTLVVVVDDPGRLLRPGEVAGVGEGRHQHGVAPCDRATILSAATDRAAAIFDNAPARRRSSVRAR